MVIANKIPTSSPSYDLNNINICMKLKTFKFCKAYCKPRRRICPRALARSQLIRQRHDKERNGNFILISIKYITQFYHWTNEYLSTDDFLRSIVESAILFAIGVKLTRELKAWNLTRTVVR